MLGASVLSTFGWILGLLSVAEVATALVAARYQESEAVIGFAGSSLVCSFVALGLIFGFRDRKIRLRRRHGLALVVLVWLGVPAFAALPFAALMGGQGAGAAYFEAVSAFTTTGSTLATSVDALPRSLIFWRVLLAWSGGAMTIVFAVASLDRLRWETGEGLLIFSAGLADPDRLLQAAREILPLYALLTALCFLGLLATGIPRFDAMSLAFSSLSTSGIMPREGDFSAYGSLGATALVTLFMAAGGAIFFISRAITSRRRLRPEATAEVVTGGGVIVLVTAFVVFSLAIGGAAISEIDLAGSLFSVISLMSTSGFFFSQSIAGNIPIPAIFVLIMVGGIYGSTAGGLKISRVLYMLRDARRELEHLVHPSAVVHNGDRAGAMESGRVVWTYFFAYLMIFSILAIVTAYHGVDFEHSLIWSAAMVSNSGPTLAYLPLAEMDPLRLIASEKGGVLLYASVATMVLGRIEVLALLAILTPVFWRR